MRGLSQAVRRHGVVVALMVALLPAGAGADRAASRPDPATAEATRRYENGIKLYNLSEWKGALEEFKQGYLIKADRAFLFNIAQCQRQLGDYEAAEKSYRAFLRESPGLPPAQEQQVRTLIAQMEEAVREARAKLPPTGTDPMALAAPPPAPAPGPALELVKAPPPKTPVTRKKWFWGVVGAGGAAVIAAVVLGSVLGTYVETPTPSLGEVRGN